MEKFFTKMTRLRSYFWLFFIFLFLALRLPGFLVDAFVPDEIWHVLHMQDIQRMSYAAVDNYQGHGSFFWYFGALIERHFGDENTFFILRICSLVALFSTVFFIILLFKRECSERNQSSLFLFSIFVLTLPIFWWGGKLIFPEFFQCLLVVLAYYCILIRKSYSIIGFFALGFCFGLKLHAGPVVAFFIADSFFRNLSFSRFYCFTADVVALTIGFLVCNPTIINNFSLFIANIKSNGDYFYDSLDTICQHWIKVLTGRYSEWDLVYFGGIDKTAIPLVNLVFLLVMVGSACAQKKCRWSSFLIFIASVIFSLTINQRFLSYYAFTPIILILLLSIQEMNKRAHNLNVLLVISILFNLLTVVPNVLVDRQLFTQMADNLQHAKAHTDCILSAVPDNQKIPIVINNTEVGRNAKRENFLIKSLLLEKMKPLGLASEDAIVSNIAGDELIISQIKKDILQSFFDGKSVFLYLDGKRMRFISRYANFSTQVQEYLAEVAHGKDYLIMQPIKTCFGTKVYMISVKNKGPENGTIHQLA